MDDNPLIIHGYPWIIRGYPWIVHGWESVRHQMTRHSSWRCEPDQSRWCFGPPLCTFRDFQVSTFHFFVFGGTVDHQGSVWGQPGPPRIILEVSCLSVTFPEIHKSLTIDFFVFPVTGFDGIQGNRCGIDVRSFTSPCVFKNYGVSFIFSCLGSRWSNLGNQGFRSKFANRTHQNLKVLLREPT